MAAGVESAHVPEFLKWEVMYWAKEEDDDIIIINYNSDLNTGEPDTTTTSNVVVNGSLFPSSYSHPLSNHQPAIISQPNYSLLSQPIKFLFTTMPTPIPVQMLTLSQDFDGSNVNLSNVVGGLRLENKELIDPRLLNSPINGVLELVAGQNGSKVCESYHHRCINRPRSMSENVSDMSVLVLGLDPA